MRMRRNNIELTASHVHHHRHASAKTYRKIDFPHSRAEQKHKSYHLRLVGKVVTHDRPRRPSPEIRIAAGP